MKVKVSFEMLKGGRIYRFPRNVFTLVSSDWILMKKGDDIVATKTDWEDEHLINLKSSGYEKLYHSVNANTIKAFIRKIRKYSLPNGIIFKNFGGWIGHDTYFRIKNSISELAYKKKIYRNLELSNEYKLLTNIDSYDNLIKSLRDNNYVVSVSMEESYSDKSRYFFINIRSLRIRAAFCSENNDSYRSINNRFAADKVDEFDKWSRCPLVCEIPKNKEEIESLLKELEYLSEVDEYESKFIENIA